MKMDKLFSTAFEIKHFFKKKKYKNKKEAISKCHFKRN